MDIFLSDSGAHLSQVKWTDRLVVAVAWPRLSTWPPKSLNSPWNAGSKAHWFKIIFWLICNWNATENTTWSGKIAGEDLTVLVGDLESWNYSLIREGERYRHHSIHLILSRHGRLVFYLGNVCGRNAPPTGNTSRLRNTGKLPSHNSPVYGGSLHTIIPLRVMQDISLSLTMQVCSGGQQVGDRTGVDP